MLRRLGHEPVAQHVVAEDLLHHRRQRGRVAGAEAQPDALAAGDDLAQAAGVGDDARAAGGHRLEGHEPERLVQRRDHAEVGDRVERVQHRVVDPAEEDAVALEAEPARLRPEVALRRTEPATRKRTPPRRSITPGSASSARWKPFS
jgi:hypothetical protein